jgi:CRP-like cAMP-binding protein
MPVTAKLSRAFYEKLGDALANELVEWLNQVDAAYRSDLRELNELNFARFDAKVEQRFAQFDAKVEQRFAQFEAKVEQRFAQVDARFSQFEAKVEQRFAQFDAKLDGRVAELRAEIQIGLQSLETKLIRWMFLFWIGQAATTVGVVFGLLKLTAR